MTENVRTLRIGIASREQMKARTLAIARSEYKPAADEPKVWFTSLESLAQVLSGPNRLLLEMIKTARPASLRELANMSERRESNLSRTLHTMQRYGLVHLNKVDHRVVPEVLYDDFTVFVPLAHTPSGQHHKKGRVQVAQYA